MHRFRWFICAAALSLCLTAFGCGSDGTSGDDAGGAGGSGGAAGAGGSDGGGGGGDDGPPCIKGSTNNDVQCAVCMMDAITPESCAEEANDCFLTPELLGCGMPSCGLKIGKHPPFDLQCIMENCTSDFFKIHACLAAACEGYTSCF